MINGNEKMTVISRDPFAREDRVRRVVYGPMDGCTWCGGFRPWRRNGKNPGFKLFEYGTWSDGGRVSWNGRGFCCISCFRIYNGEAK